jgi:hypothetical protein
MEKIFGPSWLTTVIGLVIALLNAAVPLAQTGTVSSETLIQSLGYAALGWAAKTFNVTGPPKA